MSDLLSNDIIKLRAMEPTDLDLLYKWENDPMLWTVSNTITPYSRENLWNYLKNNENDIFKTRELRLIITLKATNEAIGTVDFMDFDPINSRAELGLFIVKEQQNKGLGAQVLNVVKNYACNGIGVRQIYVQIHADNTGCLSLFRKFGFREVGVMQSWIKRGATYHDVHLLQCVF